MARKKVTLKDKAIVKKRLAEGYSLRKAIEGTAIKSPHTARRIGKEKAHDIAQMRKNYLTLIEGFGASEIDRAELWAKMTRANKNLSAMIIYKKGSKVGEQMEADERTNDFIEVPDWANREKALKYIDSLGGIDDKKDKGTKVQVNVFNKLNKGGGEFIEGEEV